MFGVLWGVQEIYTLLQDLLSAHFSCRGPKVQTPAQCNHTDSCFFFGLGFRFRVPDSYSGS